MSRYTDVDKTLEELNCLFKESNVKCLDFMRIGYNHAVADSIAAVKGQPIVEVVRCKDCKHSIEDKLFGGLWCQHPTEKHCERNADFYCGSGEREDDVEIH